MSSSPKSSPTIGFSSTLFPLYVSFSLFLFTGKLVSKALMYVHCWSENLERICAQLRMFSSPVGSLPTQRSAPCAGFPPLLFLSSPSPGVIRYKYMNSDVLPRTIVPLQWWWLLTFCTFCFLVLFSRNRLSPPMALCSRLLVALSSRSPTTASSSGQILRRNDCSMTFPSQPACSPFSWAQAGLPSTRRLVPKAINAACFRCSCPFSLRKSELTPAWGVRLPCIPSNHCHLFSALEEWPKSDRILNDIQVFCTGGMATWLAILYLLDVGSADLPVDFRLK